MYLVEGRKRWRLYHPRYFGAIFDPLSKQFHDSRAPDGDLPARAAGRALRGRAGPGEMIFVPAGWPHEVATLEPSLGIGGSVINAYQLEATVRSWLLERALGIQASEDLAESNPRARDIGRVQRGAAGAAHARAADVRAVGRASPTADLTPQPPSAVTRPGGGSTPPAAGGPLSVPQQPAASTPRRA